MSATKRKFHSLLSGMGSKSQTSLNRTSTDDSQKRRRISTSPSSSASASQRIMSSSKLSTKNKVSVATNISNPGYSYKVTTLEAEPPAKYTPWDREKFLERLETFSAITKWYPKEKRINEVEWAKRGWYNNGPERVRCVVCSKELVIKLPEKKLKDWADPEMPGFDNAAIDVYVNLIVDGHDDDCLYKKRGCDDTIYKMPLTQTEATISSLRKRYDELYLRKDQLPYEFNLQLPGDVDIDTILSYLPSNFFTTPPPISTATDGPDTDNNVVSPDINRIAFIMALFGWSENKHPTWGQQLKACRCQYCFRVLGLWLFRSKAVDDHGNETEPAIQPFLNPAKEHRDYCPWQNANTQNGRSASNSVGGGLAGWEMVVRLLKNEHYFTTSQRITPKPKVNSSKITDVSPEATAAAARAPEVVETASTQKSDEGEMEREEAIELTGDEEAAINKERDRIRDEEDKKLWARIKRVKTIFRPKTPKDGQGASSKS